LVILFGFIWYNSDITEIVIGQPLKASYGANYGLKMLEKHLSQGSSEQSEEQNMIEPVATSDSERYKTWEEEHFYAAKVFQYFMQRDFTKETTCAIIGNMMIETSGGTLDLKPEIYSKSGNYYGLCQWSMKYYPEARDLPFEQQLDYLLGTMPWEFNTFGWLYEEGFDYEDFTKMSDPEEAALAFAKVYERCGPASYELRKNAATEAYEYFDLEAPLS
jgi:hypothetical protein